MNEPGTDPSIRLLERARGADDSALDELVQRCLPRLRRWARGRLPAAASDLVETDALVEDTVKTTLRNLPRVDVQREGALHASLREALARRLRDAFPTPEAAGETSIDGSLAGPGLVSPLQQAIGDAALRRYENALWTLGNEERETIILRVELCYDYDDIARMLGMAGADAARTAVCRALARLSLVMR
jgi:DNA-directed RNA polymerase specialized sigma24 family protein